MSEATTGPRLEHSLPTMLKNPAEKEPELQPATLSRPTGATSLDHKARTNSASSSHEVLETRNAIVFDHCSSENFESASEEGSDTFFSNGSSSSSPNSLSPDSLHTTFPETNAPRKKEENPRSRRNSVRDIISRSNSDAETVTPLNYAVQHNLDIVSSENSVPKEVSALSDDCTQENPDTEIHDTWDSTSGDGSGSSSQDCSDTFSPVDPGSFSPASSSTLSQDSVGTDELEPRTPRGSQHVCAYASPVQNGCRTRTSCDRNDDIGRWHVDPDGFINEARRAGGPYLFPLPTIKLKLKNDDPLDDILEDYTIVPSITTILTEHGIYPRSVRLRKCEYEFLNELDYLPTLIISASRDTCDDSWVTACREIWQHLSNVGLGQVNVEISDFESTPSFVSPIQTTDPVWPFITEIQSRITSDVDTTDMITLGIRRMGKCDGGEKMLFTVLMSVRYDSNRDWRHTRDQIVRILDDMNLPMVGVTIVKAKAWGQET